MYRIYGVKRKITDDECREEIASLRRGMVKGSLDDRAYYLAAQLDLGVTFGEMQVMR
jgi:hypothetical protein